MEARFRATLELRLAAFTLSVEIDVKAGETVVILGPNGSGKTTCLELIAGLRSPVRGYAALDDTVFIDTARGIDLPPEARHVGFLTQQDSLFPHRTVGQNVAYGPRARGLSRDRCAAVVDEWLRRLDIGAFRDRRVETLSGGQRQRVALARALASGARLLLLDEPFSALDATSRAGVRAELAGFLSGVGIPALVVTHDPVDALVMGHRIAVIEEGAVIQSGVPEELVSRPRSPFVAALVDLNFYHALLSAGSGLKEARVGSAVFHVVADSMAGNVHLAFPPSAVTLSPERPAGSAQNVFRATIREMRPLPDRVRVVLDAGFTLAADVTREATQRLGFAAGQSQWAMVKAMAISVYP